MLAVQVPPDAHRSVLVDLLTVHGVRQGGGLGKSIVFTRTKRDADEVAAAIAQSLACEPLHGDISQTVRVCGYCSEYPSYSSPFIALCVSSTMVFVLIHITTDS